MAIIPPKVLVINVTNLTPANFWSEDDGTSDPWLGYDYQWTCTLNISPTPHSNHLVGNGGLGFEYNGLDVKVGDWIATGVSGIAVKIIALMSTPTTSTVEVLVEDVDRYNIFNDPAQLGSGIGQAGPGFLFEIGRDGLPILGPIVPNTLPLEFQSDLIARFRHRNLLKQYHRVNQSAHGLEIGEFIYLTSSGSYEPADASNVDSANVVGQVTEIHEFAGDPNLDWFTFQPIGEIIEGINPPLPGNPGDLIYLSDSSAGDYTAVRPSRYAKPIFIQLEVPTKGIKVDRGIEGPRTHVVLNLAERNSLAAREGDQVFVMDAGNGEYAQYIWDGSTWRLIVTQDASTTDAQTISVDVDHTTVSPIAIHTVSDGSRVNRVTVAVSVTFDDILASLSIGDSGNNSRLMSIDLNDLSELGVYDANPSYHYRGGGDVVIEAYLDPGTSTQGEATVTISYV